MKSICITEPQWNNKIVDVSVAMCTYNGYEFLQPQLESILNQTRPPDEIIVFDDGSNDGTQSLLAEYKENHSDIFGLHLNEENIGPNRNFERAISACSGDVIAISDQDDIWDKKKLERQLEEFRRQDTALIFHNSTVAKESLDTVTTLWETLSPKYRPKDKEPAEQFSSIVKRNFVQGASMLFNASLREHCLPLPEYWPYDYWIATVAAYREGIYGIDESLLIYRQHEEQVVGALEESFLHKVKLSLRVGEEEYRSSVDQWMTLYKTIEQTDDSEMIVEKEDALQAVGLRAQYAELRALIYEEPPLAGIKHWFRNLRKRNYHLYGNGWRGAIKDLGRISLNAIE